jgi:hypothetical protein
MKTISNWWSGDCFVERIWANPSALLSKSQPKTGHIRSTFDNTSVTRAKSYGQETKVFGEPELPAGTLARLGPNEGGPQNEKQRSAKR